MGRKAPSSRFVSLTVSPGRECKLSLPGCSALELKNAALASNEAPTRRCTLECDLATHSFVLASIPPGAKRQAVLGTVLTNDPNEPAWLFFKATGPCAFHVVGRLQVDGGAEAESSEAESSSESSGAAGAGTVEESDDDWGLGPAKPYVKPSAAARKGAKAAAKAAGHAERDEEDGDEDGEDLIEVLLPDGVSDPEYPTDAESEASDEFVEWMQTRTSGADAGAAKAKAKPGAKKPAAEGPKHGGSRSQRRRAGQKRAAQAMGEAGGGDGAVGPGGSDAAAPARKSKTKGAAAGASSGRPRSQLKGGGW